MRYVIRVVTHRPTDPVLAFDHDIEAGDVLEHLAALGYVKIHRRDNSGSCFDFLAPRDATAEESRTWAMVGCKTLSRAGANAVLAPEWVDA